VQPVEGTTLTADEVVEHCTHHIARYKLPKAVVFRDHLMRSPAGKADYRWAREQATEPA
jgi:fatty-acyl-CoA synthase